MDTMRSKYHFLSNKINISLAYLSVFKDFIENSEELKKDDEQKQMLLKNCQILEKNFYLLEEEISAIKSITYRFVPPDEKVSGFFNQMGKDNEKIRLLFVDDEEELCNILKFKFRKDGFQVDTATTIEDAKRLIMEKNPQLVLLDLYLRNGMDGIEVLEFIRNEKPGIKCLLVTREYNEEVLSKVRGLKPDDILVKPVAMDQLRAKINGLLSTMQVKGI